MLGPRTSRLSSASKTCGSSSEDLCSLNGDQIDPITDICLSVYPEQRTGFWQATAQCPYWLNGADPLDHINIYVNNRSNTTSYLHYVSLGLTDLYGDERLFE